MRNGDLAESDAEPAERPDRLLDGTSDLRINALRLEELARKTDRHLPRGTEIRQRNLGSVARGRVERVRPFDRLIDSSRIPHRPRKRPDLVETRRHRDEAGARDAAVGRLEAGDAAERRRLADRTARVRAERDERHPRRDRRRRAAG
mgnify:CR=1 FL=1